MDNKTPYDEAKDIIDYFWELLYPGLDRRNVYAKRICKQCARKVIITTAENTEGEMKKHWETSLNLMDLL